MIAIAAATLRDLFAVVILFGIYSLMTAALFMDLDAVDVAFTEAAVGAGVSTVLMLTALHLTGRWEKPPFHRPFLPLLVVGVTGAALVYGTLDAPLLGDPNAPIHEHVAPRYINQAPTEVGMPNMVTAVLASYRGYVTFSATVVIFTAGIAVLLLLGITEGPHTRPGRSAIGDQLVLHSVVKMLVPFILIYALYVQFHGDFGAGGGFQAGVFFATGFILYDRVFVTENGRGVMPANWLPRLAALGDDHARPPRLGDRDVQAADRPRPDHEHRVEHAAAHELIGEGTHTRFVIDLERFQQLRLAVAEAIY